MLRYNQSQAYTAHLDYMTQNDEHDFDSGKLGTNRFATVIMYFNDVESGGETCFPETDVPAGLPSDDEILESLWEGDMKVRALRRGTVLPIVLNGGGVAVLHDCYDVIYIYMCVYIPLSCLVKRGSSIRTGKWN